MRLSVKSSSTFAPYLWVDNEIWRGFRQWSSNFGGLVFDCSAVSRKWCDTQLRLLMMLDAMTVMHLLQLKSSLGKALLRKKESSSVTSSPMTSSMTHAASLPSLVQPLSPCRNQPYQQSVTTLKCLDLWSDCSTLCLVSMFCAKIHRFHRSQHVEDTAGVSKHRLNAILTPTISNNTQLT